MRKLLKKREATTTTTEPKPDPNTSTSAEPEVKTQLEIVTSEQMVMARIDNLGFAVEDIGRRVDALNTLIIKALEDSETSSTE